jgi:hypothetical protein
MEKYSQANLLAKELSWFPNTTDFFSRFLHKINKSTMITFTMNVPLNFYFRTEVFCEDIEELGEVSFNQNDLLNMLYNDFLLYAKKYPEPHKLLRLLSSIDEEANKERGLIQEGTSVFKTVYKDKEQKMQELQIRMKRKEALRGEILLADMNEVYPNHGYTLERVFEILYCDFIDKFRKGNNSEAINNILKALAGED